MRIWVITYIATALAFLGCDAVWLTLMARRLYRPGLGAMMRENFALAPAIVFYVIYVAGILFFAIAPARASGLWSTALIRGMALGLVAYGTYDLTNQATLRGWPLAITLADLGWGMTVTGLAATAGFIASRVAGGPASTG